MIRPRKSKLSPLLTGPNSDSGLSARAVKCVHIWMATVSVSLTNRSTVSSSEKEHFESVLGGMKGLPILTIGDAPGFARRGGIMNFILEDNKVRFEVNVEAAKDADLTISSRLLTLARIVQQVGAEGGKTE